MVSLGIQSVAHGSRHHGLEIHSDSSRMYMLLPPGCWVYRSDLFLRLKIDRVDLGDKRKQRTLLEGDICQK